MSRLRPHVLLATADGIAFCELAQALESNGYPFTAVRNGDEALARLTEAGGPRVAVLDRRLRGMGGDEIVRRLRERGQEPGAYVFCVLLDPLGDGAPAVAADSVLPPPFDPFRMLVALQSMLRIDTRQVHDEAVEAERTPPPEPVIDPVTGVWDGDSVEAYLAGALARAPIDRTHVGAVRVRIDDFARVGRQYAEGVQRNVLRACGRLVRDRVRSGEGLGRVGPAEFMIVTVGDGPDGATLVADRVRAAVRQTVFDAGGAPLRLTVSVGVAVSAAGRDGDCLLDYAGEALIDAETAGGDRVAEWRPPAAAQAG